MRTNLKDVNRIVRKKKSIPNCKYTKSKVPSHKPWIKKKLTMEEKLKQETTL